MSSLGTLGATSWARELLAQALEGDGARALTEHDRSAALAVVDRAAAAGTLPLARASRLRAYLLSASLERLEGLRGRISESVHPASSVADRGASPLLGLRVELAAARRSSAPVSEAAVWETRVGHVVALRAGAAVESARVCEVGVDARGALELVLETVDGARRRVAPECVLCPAPVDGRVRLDLDNLSELRESVTQALRAEPGAFPRLGDFEINAAPTPRYNCIAYTVRSESVWLWSGSRVDDFDRLYREHGFLPLPSLDYTLCPGFEKVVLYGFRPDSPGYGEVKAYHLRHTAAVDEGAVCVHGVVQDEDGGWLSKNGRRARLKVAHPEDLAGGDYGEPLRVYMRPRRVTAA